MTNLLVVLFGVAVLAALYVNDCRNRTRLIAYECARRSETEQLANILYHRFDRVDVSLDEHHTSSALSHAQTHSATKHFEDTVVDVQAQAERLRQHAQQFLDRSEAAATNTRQVVPRG